jgi:pimeloyl-ACP methyl ester carboxylesterase
LLRRGGLRWLFVAVVLVSGAAGEAAADGQTIKLRAASDSWPIAITYFPVKSSDAVSGKGTKAATGSPDAGVVVLLHGKGGDRLVWERKHADAKKSLVEILQDLGLAVVTVDMRKHGESVIAGTAPADATLRNEDYQLMWRIDLEAVKEFLYEEHQDRHLNMSKLAIVAAGEMAPIAAQFAVFDWSKPPHDDAPATSPRARTPRGQDVRALVFLSPSNTAGNINIMGPMKALRPTGVATLVMAGQVDGSASTTTKHLERLLKAADRDGTRTAVHIFPEVKFHGTDLLGHSSIRADELIGQFLGKHLVALDIPWRDRRSRLEQ